jgi:hypothetical protein
MFQHETVGKSLNLSEYIFTLPDYVDCRRTQKQHIFLWTENPKSVEQSIKMFISL